MQKVSTKNIFSVKDKDNYFLHWTHSHQPTFKAWKSRDANHDQVFQHAEFNPVFIFPFDFRLSDFQFDSSLSSICPISLDQPAEISIQSCFPSPIVSNCFAFFCLNLLLRCHKKIEFVVPLENCSISMFRRSREEVYQFVIVADSLYHFSLHLLFVIRGMKILSIIDLVD